MMHFIDCFGRNTIIEILPSAHNSRLSVVIRKERLTIYESLTLDVAQEFIKELQLNIKTLEKGRD